MESENEKQFQRLLSERKADHDLSSRDRKKLKQPVTRVRADNIFTWHLNTYTVFEDETDPDLIRQGVRLRRVGVKPSGRLSKAQIESHERRLGIRLPLLWREVYRHFNGGFVHELYWGDLDDPRMSDIEPIPHSSHEYLALEDVAPLCELLPQEIDGVDGRRLDPRLIAIACKDRQAVLLDYREGDDPRVCCAYFDRYNGDPLAKWEEDDFTFWWPNMEVFFRGLYRQDRIL